MALGFKPKYKENYQLGNLTPEQFLFLAMEAAKKLGWNITRYTQTGFIAITPLSMGSWSEEVVVKIRNGNAELVSECAGNQLMDWGKNTENIRGLREGISELQKTITADDIAKGYEGLKPNMLPEEDDIITATIGKGKFTNLLSFFVLRKDYFVTPILVELNILIFLIMVASGVSFFLPSTLDLVKWGANFRPITLDGQWWRLLTSCFLHIGVFHILMNMVALFFIGVLLEPILGKIRFAAAYLLTGIISSTVSLWWHNLTVSVGASGAIFGMYGVFLALLTTDFIERNARRALFKSIGVFVVYNLLFGLKGGIDNSAHIGGLISGIVIGYAYVPGLRKIENIKLKYITVGIISVLMISASYTVYRIIPNDIGEYSTKMKQFSELETSALELYKLPNDATKEKRLRQINEVGIPDWLQCMKLAVEIDKLNLPSKFHDRNKVLYDYCYYRMLNYRYLYRVWYYDSVPNRDSMKFYNTMIEGLLNDLKNRFRNDDSTGQQH